jgi:hypothetical protein
MHPLYALEGKIKGGAYSKTNNGRIRKYYKLKTKKQNKKINKNKSKISKYYITRKEK